MGATLADIKGGLEQRLCTIPGLRVRDHVPEQIEPPMAVVVFQRREFHGAMQLGMQPFEFGIVVLVGAADARRAQEDLLEYADTTGIKSVRAAIEGDRTLGGLDNTDAIVVGVEAFETEQVGGYRYLGVTFDVEVKTR